MQGRGARAAGEPQKEAVEGLAILPATSTALKSKTGKKYKSKLYKNYNDIK